MDSNVTQRRILVGLAAVVAIAAGIALALATRDETTVIAAGRGDALTTTEPELSSTTETTDDSTPSSTTIATAPETTIPETTVPDEGTVCRPDTDPACFDTSGLEATLIAELLDGVRLTRYAEPTDTDCAAGTLVAESDDTILRIYDLPFAGGIRALSSAFGPTALIGSCEEWISWVAFYEEPSSSRTAPTITAHELPEDVFFLWDFQWVGMTGYLGATASFSDGASPATTAPVVIDAADGSIRLADDVFGSRSTRSPDGFDVLIPNGWELVESEPAIEVRLPESGSRLRVASELLTTGSLTPEARDDETVDSVVDIDITVWGDSDGVQPSTWADGTETRFVSAASTRYVRTIELDDRFVTIEAEFAPGTSRGEALFVLYLLDQVRVFDTVG